MAEIYRSVRLVVLNAAACTFTLAGAEVLSGEWAPENKLGLPTGGIAPQSAVTVTNRSTTLHYGAEGFLRLDSVRGLVHLHWRLPWVGRFSIEHEADPRHLRVGFDVLESEPAEIAVLTTISAVSEGA